MAYYSARKAAKILNVSTATVISWIEKGKIRAEKLKKLSKTYYKIPESEINRLKKELGLDK
jgi:excisionase family DNA binding protein